MEAGGIAVTRSLSIDGALVPNVLSRLRRDVPGGVARWTLGGRGSAEVDVEFSPIVAESGSGPAWTTTVRLWDPAGVAMLAAALEIRSESVDACGLTLRPVADLAPWWLDRLPALLELAHSAVDEIGEELLWHATRDDVAMRSGF
jgi:hypothetical protein